MQTKRDEYYSIGDIISIAKAFIIFLLGRWWKALLVIVLCSLFGLAYYLIQNPKYRATCTFILEEKQGGLGGLGSIASQFGIDVGGFGSSSLFAGDNILEILKSNTIIKKVLLSKVDSLKGENSPTLADVYMTFSRWNEKKSLKDISYNNSVPAMFTLKQDSVLQLMQEALVKNNVSVERVNRKGSIISVTITSPDQYFSKLLAERMVGEARNMYITVKVGTAQENVKRLEQKADSILALLNSKTYQAASAFAIDPNPALRSLSVPSEISSRDKTVLGAVYLEVVKNLEVSRTILNQQTPIIQLLDVPQLPIENKAKGLLLLLIGFGFLGGCLYSVYAWFKFSQAAKKGN